MQRTITINRTVFDFNDEEPVSYDFSNESHGIVQITIPSRSKFWLPFHWHTDTHGCSRLETVEGVMHLFVAYRNGIEQQRIGPGVKADFAPDDRVTWGRGRVEGEPLIVLLVANTVLFRNICGAMTDAENFPHLATTPLWLRLLCKIPALKGVLVWRLLWIQLRCMYYAHDFRTSEGYIPFTLLWSWPFEGSPKWLRRLQTRSLYVISRVVLWSCYWMGRLLLGMRGQYAEYTPPASEDAIVPDNEQEKLLADV